MGITPHIPPSVSYLPCLALVPPKGKSLLLFNTSTRGFVVVQPKGLFGVYSSSAREYLDRASHSPGLHQPNVSSWSGVLLCPFPAGASASFPASCLSQALPCDVGILWLMGTMWPLRSIHPTPLSPFPGQPDAGWRAREIFLRLHQGVPGSRLSRGYRELLHRWGFPSCSQCPAFSIPAPRAPPAFPVGACPGPNPEESISLHVCAYG